MTTRPTSEPVRNSEPKPSPAQACPCGRPLPYAQCCGLYIERFDDCPAPDAEALMRSRYTAFTLGRWSHVRATWWPANCPPELSDMPGTKWLGLEVRAHRSIDADHAEVEFVARYRVQGRAVRLHERSRFVRDAGRWWYVDGDDLGQKNGTTS